MTAAARPDIDSRPHVLRCAMCRSEEIVAQSLTADETYRCQDCGWEFSHPKQTSFNRAVYDLWQGVRK